VLTEPPEKRAIAFIDGQNLYHAARESFGYPLTRIMMSGVWPKRSVGGKDDVPADAQCYTMAGCCPRSSVGPTLA